LFLVLELLFIILLIAILFMVYGNERTSSKGEGPQGRAEEYWDGKERRKHIRFRKALDINYSVRKKSRHNNPGRTADISEGGIKLLLDEKLQKGVIIGLKIPLPNSHQPVEIEAEVMWSEEAPHKDMSGKRFFYSGVMFRGSSDPSYELLDRYVRSLQPGESK
jgi:c-di-GMP-binding flagellar brake protein YcgR